MPSNSREQFVFMQRAVELSKLGSDQLKGGPFGCVIVKDGVVVGEGYNLVTSTNDPTAHAEIVAIREACKNLGSFQLNECEIYSSCEPCPMCLGAIYWARPSVVFYANTRKDAAMIGFDDDFIYQELDKKQELRSIIFKKIESTDAASVFKDWSKNQNRTSY